MKEKLSLFVGGVLGLVFAVALIVGINKWAASGDRNPSWGYWVCSNHHHVVKKVDFMPEVQRLSKEDGCTGWYLERQVQ